MELIPLLPDVEDEDGKPFWQASARGELCVQSCGSCGHSRFPPRPMCPDCQSTETKWRELSGRGKIWSFVLVHPPVLPAYADVAPYPVVVVELEEDASLRMVGNLVSAGNAPINSVDPSTIEIGQAVQVAFTEVDGVHLPRWVPIVA